MTDFIELGVRHELARAMERQGIVEPTQVQMDAIPVILDGRDVTVEAQTGTGKTLAFALPILTRIDAALPNVQALVITPTRELAAQITEEIRKATQFVSEVAVLSIYGGQDVTKQMKHLKAGVHIVVATPGRLLDHLRRATVDLSHVSMLVLDEADEMLKLGFLEEVESILRELPATRQTMLFSATMPTPIRKMGSRYLHAPKHIKVERKTVTVDFVEQYVILTSDRLKQEALRRYLDEHYSYLAILFCRTKRRAKTLCEALVAHGYNADELHGDLSQASRETVIKRFRNADIQYLVATDVAARGLDVEGVTHVFNYDIPHDVESYIHRIGRTARAGEKGIAVTFVAPKDMQHLHMIERGIRQTIPKLESERSIRLQQPKPRHTSTQGSMSHGGRQRRSNTGGKPGPKAPQESGRRGRSNTKAPTGRGRRGR